MAGVVAAWPKEMKTSDFQDLNSMSPLVGPDNTRQAIKITSLSNSKFEAIVFGLRN